jgi:hypothetical protein
MASVCENLEVNVKDTGFYGIQSVSLVIMHLVVALVPLIVLKAMLMVVMFVKKFHMAVVSVNLVRDARMKKNSMVAYVILNVPMDIMAGGQYAGLSVLVICLMIAILKYALQIQQRVYLCWILPHYLFVNIKRYDINILRLCKSTKIIILQALGIR